MEWSGAERKRTSTFGGREELLIEKLNRVFPAERPHRFVIAPDQMFRELAVKLFKEEGYYELFLLELGTGMRRGEILALKWSDLNFITGELRINKQITALHGELLISEPKTKACQDKRGMRRKARGDDSAGQG